MVMDLTPTVLILTPVLLPLVKEANIDPIYFGVMFIINCLYWINHTARWQRPQRYFRGSKIEI
ncbi:dehydroascorbate transporter [Salmonella enterica subsp. enterica]|nr:dehydroascorbate transporter [Salmonella enterica subsp. enterica]